MADFDAQDARIIEILGDDADAEFDVCRDRFCTYLAHSLQFPIDVTGIEDFRWEGYYVIGPGDRKEYESLRTTRPSYKDIFELLSISASAGSEWMMYCGRDLAGLVRRKSDGKEFYLGLAEIQAVNKKSKNYQLLNDYAAWFANND